jgi:hypothetical protein
MRVDITGGGADVAEPVIGPRFARVRALGRHDFNGNTA